MRAVTPPPLFFFLRLWNDVPSLNKSFPNGEHSGQQQDVIIAQGYAYLGNRMMATVLPYCDNVLSNNHMNTHFSFSTRPTPVEWVAGSFN